VALPIAPITSPVTPVAPSSSRPTNAPSAASSRSFGESLSQLLDSVESSDQAANASVANMLDGSGDVHDAMIALQRAELTLQLTVQMRNKLVQAYQDIMRMPV
jgi:flagellar hook-basal body complex protein FliE